MMKSNSLSKYQKKRMRSLLNLLSKQHGVQIVDMIGIENYDVDSDKYSFRETLLIYKVLIDISGLCIVAEVALIESKGPFFLPGAHVYRIENYIEKETDQPFILFLERSGIYHSYQCLKSLPSSDKQFDLHSTGEVSLLLINNGIPNLFHAGSNLSEDTGKCIAEIFTTIDALSLYP